MRVGTLPGSFAALSGIRTGVTRPLILVSNDDGVEAAGLRALRAALARFADVVVVAPAREQSAKSHALSLHHPLRHRIHPADAAAGPIHSVDGTPADCVYVGLFREGLLPRRPDLCASGINHGPNLGVDVHYSGTVAAAREAALRGIPAIAFSQIGGRPEVYRRSADLAATLCERLLSATPPSEGTTPLLNVNFPAEAPLGVRTTRMGIRRYDEGVDVRVDPRGGEYVWIGGPGGVTHGELEQSDTGAVDEGFVSVTPLRLDVTHPDHFGLAAFMAGPPEEASQEDDSP